MLPHWLLLSLSLKRFINPLFYLNYAAVLGFYLLALEQYLEILSGADQLLSISDTDS